MDYNFRTQYDEPLPGKLKPGYSFDPVPGFQEHAAESIGTLINRFIAGDLTVGRALYGDDDYPFETYPDSFDVMDRYNEVSERSNHGAQDHGDPESSDSEPEQPLGNAQGDDNPGDSEISGK